MMRDASTHSLSSLREAGSLREPGSFLTEAASISRPTLAGFVPRLRFAEPERTHRVLLVMSPAGVCRVPLPERGERVVGRTPIDGQAPVDRGQAVEVADDGVSPQHLRLCCARDQVTVEALDPKVPTRLWGQPLPPRRPVPLPEGVGVGIGSTVLMLIAARLRLDHRRLWSHEAFFIQVEEECVRAARRRGSFALLRVRPPRRAAVGQDLAPVLFDLVRPPDVLGEYARGDYLVLAQGPDPTGLRLRVQELVAQIGQTHPGAVVGVASYPDDGDSPATLLDASNRRSDPRGQREKGLGPCPFPGGVYYQAVAGRAAAGGRNVIISGETGIGKTLVAMGIHELGRGNRQMRVLRPGEVQEIFAADAELLSAGRRLSALGRRGPVGTVIFRSVTELSRPTQRWLAAVLERLRSEPSLGLSRVRFIGTSRESPSLAVAAGRLVPELCERLGEFTIHLPPLRERAGEIPTLAANIVARKSARLGARPPRLDGAVRQRLMEYPWPGNYLELCLALDRALALGQNRLEAEHLPSGRSPPTAWPAYQLIFDDRHRLPLPPEEGALWPPPPPLRDRPTSERERILAVLEASGWNQSRAARMLAISRRTLLNRLDVLGISRPVKGS